MKKIRDEEFCPECFVDWAFMVDGDDTVYSRLIGIEDPMIYDGVSWWTCPNCKTMWDRWTGEKLDRKWKE